MQLEQITALSVSPAQRWSPSRKPPGLPPSTRLEGPQSPVHTKSTSDHVKGELSWYDTVNRTHSRVDKTNTDHQAFSSQAPIKTHREPNAPSKVAGSSRVIGSPPSSSGRSNNHKTPRTKHSTRRQAFDHQKSTPTLIAKIIANALRRWQQQDRKERKERSNDASSQPTSQPTHAFGECYPALHTGALCPWVRRNPPLKTYP